MLFRKNFIFPPSRLGIFGNKGAIEIKNESEEYKSPPISFVLKAEEYMTPELDWENSKPRPDYFFRAVPSKPIRKIEFPDLSVERIAAAVEKRERKLRKRLDFR